MEGTVIIGHEEDSFDEKVEKKIGGAGCASWDWESVVGLEGSCDGKMMESRLRQRPGD
jgi:hypothetical protein